mmetsp:Transcript_9503/g.20565  ORF Transcript_9503/g.20565 Transcript_9503/m.20565 type:complete len:218 (-) Transcript_9503:1224-1877(-)
MIHFIIFFTYYACVYAFWYIDPHLGYRQEPNLSIIADLKSSCVTATLLSSSTPTRRIAINVASRQSPPTSAPVASLSNSSKAKFFKLRFLPIGISPMRSFSIASKSDTSGFPMRKCSCSLPGRSNAESILWIRFVHAMTKTRLFCIALDTPSISLRSVDRMRDETSLLSSSSRLQAIASISSKNNTQGETARALVNRDRSSDSEPPSHLSKRSVART